MKKLFAMAMAALGLLAAGAATTGCWHLVLDEPEMPKSLLNK